MAQDLASWRCGPFPADPAAGKAWGVSWVIVAPWAHRAWSHYVLHLYDLVTPTVNAPAIKRVGVTHEFILFAADPDVRHPIKPGQDIKAEPPALLTPPNHGYQFTAASNQAAMERLQGVVDSITVRQLSPDTDWRWHWDHLFADGVTLRKRSPSWGEVREALRRAYGEA